MPGARVLPPAAAAAPGPLLTLVIAVVIFAVLVVTTVVVMSLLQAVLPATDTEAEAVHREELEAERRARADGVEEADRAGGSGGRAGPATES